MYDKWSKYYKSKREGNSVEHVQKLRCPGESRNKLTHQLLGQVNQQFVCKCVYRCTMKQMFRPFCFKNIYSGSAITMTSYWARWRLKSPASRLFTQLFIQAQIKENIKAPRHWIFLGEFTGHRWIPRTKGQWRGKCFHLMTSSWCRT